MYLDSVDFTIGLQCSSLVKFMYKSSYQVQGRSFELSVFVSMFSDIFSFSYFFLHLSDAKQVQFFGGGIKVVEFFTDFFFHTLIRTHLGKFWVAMFIAGEILPKFCHISTGSSVYKVVNVDPRNHGQK